MRIVQEPSYKPIVITLETREEAQAFWSLVDESAIKFPKNSGPRAIGVEISNWFNNHSIM